MGWERPPVPPERPPGMEGLPHLTRALRCWWMKSSRERAHRGSTTSPTFSLESWRQPRSKPAGRTGRVKDTDPATLPTAVTTVSLTILVLQELREVEELRDELLDIHRVLHAGLPRCRHRVELPVRAVKPGGGTGRLAGAWLSPRCPLCGIHLPGAHLPLCSWMCRVVKGSVRIR